LTKRAELISVQILGRIAVVTLNRPHVLNAISMDMAEQLANGLSAIGENRAVWVVVVAAAGERAFCVGADLKEAASLSDAAQLERRRLIRELFKTLRSIPQPTIASVFGYALGGGCELALSSDLVVASEDAVFGLTETRVGLVPGGGGMLLMPRAIGVTRTKELLFTGKHVEARKAAELGFVNSVVERQNLQPATMELAGAILRSSPSAVAEVKRTIDQSVGLPLERGLELEEAAALRVLRSRDRAEGIAAFNDKREPEWENR
jgi:enoyl-CoA hydratase/carnithine racemase